MLPQSVIDNTPPCYFVDGVQVQAIAHETAYMPDGTTYHYEDSPMARAIRALISASRGDRIDPWHRDEAEVRERALRELTRQADEQAWSYGVMSLAPRLEYPPQGFAETYAPEDLAETEAAYRDINDAIRLITLGRVEYRRAPDWLPPMIRRVGDYDM